MDYINNLYLETIIVINHIGFILMTLLNGILGKDSMEKRKMKQKKNTYIWLNIYVRCKI